MHACNSCQRYFWAIYPHVITNFRCLSLLRSLALVMNIIYNSWIIRLTVVSIFTEKSITLFCYLSKYSSIHIHFQLLCAISIFLIYPNTKGISMYISVVNFSILIGKNLRPIEVKEDFTFIINFFWFHQNSTAIQL